MNFPCCGGQSLPQSQIGSKSFAFLKRQSRRENPLSKLFIAAFRKAIASKFPPMKYLKILYNAGLSTPRRGKPTQTG